MALARQSLHPPLAHRATADRLGAFLGAAGDDLVWVDNATTGVAAVLGSLQLAPGDEIAVCDHVYGAVRNAASHVAKRSWTRSHTCGIVAEPRFYSRPHSSLQISAAHR